MGRCRRHPHHAVVGVCAHCLNDRLLALMEEEEDEEVMVHELYKMSPHAHFTHIPSSSFSSCMQAASLPKQAGFSTNARRSSTDYNHADIKQMAASYVHKHHHSLSSSPQLHPIKAPPYVKPAQKMRPTLVDARLPFVSEEITRKKRASLWSILRGHKGDSIVNERQSYGYDEQAHVRRDNHAGGPKMHCVGTRNNHVSGATKHRPDTSRRVDTAITDGFAYPGRPSSSSCSRREVHECLCKLGDASLMSSPRFMASPSRPAHYHYPSPVSKYTPPSPLRNERCVDDRRASPGKQVHISHGVSGHVDNYVRDDDTSGSSWISTLFPRRNRRSKSISGSDAIGFSQPSYVYSVGTSPESAPRGRRKSVSFANEDLNETPTSCRYISSNTSQINGLGTVLKSPDVHARGHGYDHLIGLNANGNEVKATQNFKSPKDSLCGALGEHAISQEHALSQERSEAMQNLRSLKGNLRGALREHAIDQEHALGWGRSVNESGVNLSGSNVLKLELMASKSPRTKLVSFLNKRKNGTVSIDCGRDVRVSPVPMLRVKRDYLNHQDLLDDHDHGHGCRGHHGHDRLHQHTEHNDDDGKFTEKLQKSAMAELAAAEKEILKSPRLMSLHAMKQLLKSPKLAPVRTCKRELDDDDSHSYSQFSRSWSKAFSKTLSPMLNRKHNKKKQGIQRQDFMHFDLHTQHGYNDCSWNDESLSNRGTPNARPGPYLHSHQFSGQKHHLQHQYGNGGSNRGDDLLVTETRVLPTLDEKGPPQQYSFLSKDYSAFSFYFSPRRSGNIDRR